MNDPAVVAWIEDHYVVPMHIAVQMPRPAETPNVLARRRCPRCEVGAGEEVQTCWICGGPLIGS